MAEVNLIQENLEQVAARLVLCDPSDPSEIDSLLAELSRIRSLSEMKPLAFPCRMIVSAATAMSMLRKSNPQQTVAVCSTLISALQEALRAIEHGEDGKTRADVFVEELKALTQGGSAVPVKSWNETQIQEIPSFKANAKSLTDDLEKALLILEKTPEDKERIDEAFRHFHTIKGESNLLGFNNISALAHEAEEFLGILRAGTIQADAQIISHLLKSVDALRACLNVEGHDPKIIAGTDFSVLVRELKACRLEKHTDSVPAVVPVAIPPLPAAVSREESGSPQIPVLDLSSGPDLILEFTVEGNDHMTNSENSVLVLEKSPDNKEAINNIFRAFHTIKGAAGFLDLQDIRTLAHEAETMLDMVRKDQMAFEGRVVEATLSSIDLIRKMLELLNEQAINNGVLKSPYLDIRDQLIVLKEITSGKKHVPVGEVLVKQGVITQINLEDALKIQKEVSPEKKVGEILVETQTATPKQVQGALEVQKAAASGENSIKIQLDKLDSLIDLVGELVISETQVVQSPLILDVDDQKFHKNISELDRITRRLQQIAMGMRLVPVGPTFQKMVRLVRDLSKKLNKDIVITLSGEETEIDKNMVELVGDPLMHMVRNSIDHGIESKEIRVSRGKPPVGKIHLSAFHRGSNVVIEIKDDGGGLRKDKILAKAVERGIIKQGDELPDKRIFGLIFEPGFSTADKVTDVSGRGVGMDVVKRNIEKLRGKIEIESEEGKGSVFSIYLPITLAIIEGIVVRVGRERYILPINAVIEFVKSDEASMNLVYDKGEMFRVYDKIYPLIRLSSVFGVADSQDKFEETTVCIIESDYGRACVVVDELLGQQQVVIKNLGESLKQVQGVSGAAILGDGRVGLILDVNGLVSLAVR